MSVVGLISLNSPSFINKTLTRIIWNKVILVLPLHSKSNNMTKKIFRNNYFELNFIPYINVGIGYENKELYIGCLCFMLEIHLWMILPNPRRKSKPTTF